MSDRDRIKAALELARRYGTIDGGHHKMWVIDQMVRELTGCPKEMKSARDVNSALYIFEVLGESKEYKKFVAEHNDGPDGPDTYEWDTGIVP